MSPSTLSWLDHSEAERRRALDVVQLFEDESTVDELGIGGIRDAFADQLFPGTSTIQTRACYFLFIPWIYLDLERRRVSSRDIERRARSYELRLIDALLESDDLDGVIGKQARRTLKRLPSTIYWNGLFEWGIRVFAGSHAQYHRILDSYYRSPGSIQNEDGEPLYGRSPSNWHPGIPEPPDDFPQRAELALRRVDAQYLRERIVQQHRETVLGWLVRHGIPTSVGFVWLHPQLREMPRHNRELVEHARLFSLSMNGAALIYNLMLAEAVPNEALISEYEGLLEGWAQDLRSDAGALGRWDRDRFWELVRTSRHRISSRARRFTDRWLDLLVAEDPERLHRSDDVRRMIRGRERELKRGRARLGNRRALELWSGRSGVAPLDYRWPVTQAIVNDILRGLEADA